jgi:hypothetical protein
MQQAAVLPVHKSINVAAPAARAFELYTAGMHRWWPRDHTINPNAAREAIVVEPRVGGRWFERGVDGKECQWGKILVWEPPLRVVFGWQLNHLWEFDPNFLTEVEVRFIAVDERTTQVRLEHRYLERFGEHAAKVRSSIDSPGGWENGLNLFAEAAAKA